MKLEKKHYYWIGAAALITVVGVVVYKRRKNKQLAEQDETLKIESKTSASNIAEAQSDMSKFPIRLGAQGDSVKAIQKYVNSTSPSELKKEGVYPLEVDGVWDELTDKATLASSVLKRNEIDKPSFDRILRDLKSANISI